MISLLNYNVNDMQNRRLAILLGILMMGSLCLMISVYVQAQRQKREDIQRVIKEAEEALKNQNFGY